MKRKMIWLFVLLAVLLTGCTMQTVDQMYCLPKRSEEYDNLQSAIDKAMSGRNYSAPMAGENQQTVQQADLDGDGKAEYLLFAKSTGDKPLEIHIFRQDAEKFAHVETIQSNGIAFDQVEYVDMDEKAGAELVVGQRVSDQVLRSVCVYSFSGGQAEQLLSASCAQFLTCDLDSDSRSELMLLQPGEAGTDKGVAVLYAVKEGNLERSNEVNMSESVDNLKRIISGKLYGGAPAIFVGSSVEESAIITDVFAMEDGVFTNVSFSSESGTSVKTLRNYYVYADDIDSDGVVELPNLIPMMPVESEGQVAGHDLIRWFAMKPDGSEVEKLYTFHNFVGDWYLELAPQWASRVSVVQTGSSFDFYLWDGDRAEKIFTVFVFSGSDREEQAAADNRFVLHRGDSVVYAAHLEVASGAINITREDLINGFSLIHQDWKTGET